MNQVVAGVMGDTVSSSSTSMTDVTGLSAAITPSASDSKVLIILSMAIGAYSVSQVVARMRRNLDSVDSYPGNGTAVGSRSSGFLMMQLPSAAFMQSTVYTFLDSPASTLEATYNVQVRCETAAQVYVGYTYTDTDNVNFGRAGASITLMEILA